MRMRMLVTAAITLRGVDVSACKAVQYEESSLGGDRGFDSRCAVWNCTR